jgi:hypothetical protein
VAGRVRIEIDATPDRPRVFGDELGVDITMVLVRNCERAVGAGISERGIPPRICSCVAVVRSSARCDRVALGRKLSCTRGSRWYWDIAGR